MSEVDVQFLPYLRRGLASRAKAEKGVLTVGVTVKASVTEQKDQDVNTVLTLTGPGDVVGLSPDQVLRCSPGRGARSAPPGRLVSVEFRRADLPWLFTPEVPRDGRLRPWVVLVVFPVGPEVRLGPAGDGPLPVLMVSQAALSCNPLPDLSRSWAWAHVQAYGRAGNAAELQQALTSSARPPIARLIWPGALAPRTRYLAALVPAFKAGVAAGLGQSAEGVTGDAWPPRTGGATLALPVYLSWTFATGPAEEDVASAFRGLRRTRAPEGLGAAELVLRDPGGVPGLEVPTTFRGPLSACVAGAPVLLPGLSALLSSPQDEDEPVLLPPRYTPSTEPSNLNVAPALRLAAGLGVRVVRSHQDTLVSAALTAAPTPAAASGQSGLAKSVGTRISGRLERVGKITTTAPAALRRLTAPAGSARRAVVLRAPAAGRMGTLKLSTAKSLSSKVGRTQVSAQVSAQSTVPRPVPAIGEARPAQALAQPALVSASAAPSSTEIPLPLAPLLFKSVPRLSLPGFAALEEETLSLVSVSTEYVSAFLAGANHELARELRSRGLHGLSRRVRLSAFWPGGAEVKAVVVARGEVVRLLPGLRVSTVPAQWQGVERVVDEAKSTREAAFRLSLGEDIVAVGFAQPVQDLVGDDSPRRKRPGCFLAFEQIAEEVSFDAAKAALAWTPTGVKSAADLAQRLVQRPVQILIHARHLLSES